MGGSRPAAGICWRLGRIRPTDLRAATLCMVWFPVAPTCVCRKLVKVSGGSGLITSTLSLLAISEQPQMVQKTRKLCTVSNLDKWCDSFLDFKSKYRTVCSKSVFHVGWTKNQHEFSMHRPKTSANCFSFVQSQTQKAAKVNSSGFVSVGYVS